MYNWINKLFSEKNKVPRTLFEVRKAAGSATYKQNSMKLCRPLTSACLLSLFSHENKESLFIWFVWTLKKSVNEDLCFLIKMSTECTFKMN